VLSYYSELEREGVVEPHHGHELAGALLSSSRVFLESNDDWRYRAIVAAKALLEKQPCGGECAVEDQYLVRWQHERRRSLYVEVPAPTQVTVTDQRSNAQRGEVSLSTAYKLLKAEDLPGALEELDKFIPFDQARGHSCIESLLQERVDFLKSKIDRYRGEFSTGLKSTRELIDRVDRQFGNLGCSLVANYGEVLCELDNPTEAEKVVRSQLKNMQTYGWDNNLSRVRILECSLADVLLRQGSYEEAEGIYLKLKVLVDSHYRSRTSHLSYFHYLVGLAMAAHLDGRLEQACSHWEEVRKTISQWKWVGGFCEMVYFYAISDLNYKSGRIEEAEKFLERANELFLQNGRKFWVTNFGTCFLNSLKGSISNYTGTSVEIR
jgi:tetratricopeptide (TPR) repeat protein